MCSRDNCRKTPIAERIRTGSHAQEIIAPHNPEIRFRYEPRSTTTRSNHCVGQEYNWTLCSPYECAFQLGRDPLLLCDRRRGVARMCDALAETGLNMRPKTSPIIHDKALFERLKAAASQSGFDVTAGVMFGSPALFLGKRMIGCVFGSSIGLKVPEPVAARARAEGAARPFRPYGKSAMREWIEIDGDALGQNTTLVQQAIRFAESG